MHTPLVSDQFKVLLVDDDEQRRSSLNHIFRFLGVNSQDLSFVDWFQQPEQASSCSLAFIGRSALPISLEKMIHRFQTSCDALALCLLEPWDDQEQLSQQAKKWILRILNEPLTEPVLMGLLREAQTLDSLALNHKSLNHSEQHSSQETEIFTHEFPLLVGNSSAMQSLKLMMKRVIDRDTHVLITGESGTGKELVAKSLHEYSERADQPFVPVNCGAIPPELLESELFGHEKGAFTGAINTRMGRFEMAQGGTLFLDEVGDMPLSMQVKLLRVLQEKTFERVGGSKTFKTDVRVIAATHKHLESMVAAKDFREDLYYRLNVYPIETPSLRDRQGDMALLLAELSQRAEQQGLGALRFHPSAIVVLEQYAWPGNVRELSNLVERLAIMYPDGLIGVAELPEKFRTAALNEADAPTTSAIQPEIPAAVSSETDDLGYLGTEPLLAQPSSKPHAADSLRLPDEGLDLKAFLEAQEKQLIYQALDKANHVVVRAAELLKVRRTTLVEKMRKYSIQRGQSYEQP